MSDNLSILLSTLPKHVGLSIHHNEHKVVLREMPEYLEIHGWEGDASAEDCIKHDEIWEVSWYPRTPLSYVVVIAPTLPKALALATYHERGNNCRRD